MANKQHAYDGQLDVVKKEAAEQHKLSLALKHQLQEATQRHQQLQVINTNCSHLLLLPMMSNSMYVILGAATKHRAVSGC